jgi:large subunit ribosomal protein L23
MSGTATTRKVLKGFRMWLPTMPMVLLNARSATETRPSYATFRVLPRMTKWEVKEYLSKIYQLPAVRVQTQNHEGKRKRVVGKRVVAYYKRADWKKAFVTFDSSVKDVGVKF